MTSAICPLIQNSAAAMVSAMCCPMPRRLSCLKNCKAVELQSDLGCGVAFQLSERFWSPQCVVKDLPVWASVFGWLCLCSGVLSAMMGMCERGRRICCAISYGVFLYVTVYKTSPSRLHCMRYRIYYFSLSSVIRIVLLSLFHHHLEPKHSGHCEVWPSHFVMCMHDNRKACNAFTSMGCLLPELHHLPQGKENRHTRMH